MEETRRERKKRQTRQSLIDAAVRLFAENGYEQTTVAQIAASADVATKTFFNHFPGKEDVLFVDAERYSTMMVEVIAAPEPEETVAEVLIRAYEEAAARHRAEHSGVDDAAFAAVYASALATVPAVQAKALHIMSAQERVMADALHRAFPDRLDGVTAAAAVGSLIGALRAAGLLAIASPGEEPEHQAAVQRSLEVAVRGIGSL